MSYIDAGYSIVLGLLAAYACSLAWRRRRLERTARRLAPDAAPAVPRRLR
ncbi:MAG TPA: hypothetical protein VEJ44_01220 [Acidimicrobiales bacterium]|nr:hypothetical protein [Acidimicrobiales bacterium]